jgi:hypothetical protein
MLTHDARALLPFCLTVLSFAAACSDDDSSATTDSSSTTGSPDPSTSSSTTAVGSTGTGTGTTASTSDTGATGTGLDTGATDTGSTDTGTASDDSTGAGALDIAGEWFEEFAPGMGITHTIDELRWDQLSDFGDAVFHIDSYDNDARYVVAQGDEANEFSPGLWSRFDWTWDGDALYYCTAVYDAATAEDALAAPASEPTDLAMGCGGFPWSLLMPVR